MTRPACLVRALFACFMLASLAGAMTAPAWADGPAVTAVFGLGGRYRPGGWCPVTVKVHNPSADALDGQVQARSEADPNSSRFGRPPADTGAALFSRPLSVPGGGTGQTLLYTQGLDPGAGSVIVQVADGRTRGDGRILAQGSSTSNGGSTTPAVSGLPVTDQDLFLVGFGGDPGAFTGLNGRQTGLVHLPGVGAGPASFSPGMAAGPTSPPTGNAQVVSLLPADLPDRAVGYSGVDAFLLRGDAPLDVLSEAQADALKHWVAGGGHLVVVCSGADPGPYAAPFFQGLLPAAVQATGKGTLALTARPLPGVHSPAPALVTGPYGAGWVSVTTRDISAAAPAPAFWAALLTAPATLLGAASAHDTALAQNPYGYNGGDSALLSAAVLRGPSLDAPGTWVIGLFLLAYLIVLVPVNYLILKRLDRRELAWATIPALVIVFAVGTFAVGYAAKGGSVFVNRAAIVETAAGQTEAGVRGAVGLFSPRRTSYDLTLTGAGLAAALPPTVRSYRFGSGGDAQPTGQTRLVQTSGGAALLDTAVNMWAMRAFDFQSTTDLGGTIDARAAGNTLTVTNHTPHTLTGCLIIRTGMTYPAGTLAPGGTAQASLFSAPPVMTQVPGLPLPQMFPAVVRGSDQSVTPRMQAALADYARLLGQSDNGNAYYYNGSGMTQSRTPFAAAPDEALLVGWSDDPSLAGPAPRVDGQAVPVHSTTLVVVHLPLPASLTAQVPPLSRPFAPSVARSLYPGSAFYTHRFLPTIYVSTTSPRYKQAVDARTLTVTPKTSGKPITVRGIVSATSYDSVTKTLTVSLAHQTGSPEVFGGPNLRLSVPGYDPLPLSSTVHREIVASGTLRRGAGGRPQILVTQPLAVALVSDSLLFPAPPPARMYGLRTIPQTAPAYRQAVDARTLTVNASNASKPVAVRGIVTGNGYTVSAGQMIVTLGAHTLLLMPVSLGEQFRSLALTHREVVVFGLLTRRGSSPQIAVSQPFQVLVVGGSSSGMAPPASLAPPPGPLPGSAYAAVQFPHVLKSAALYRQASTPQTFVAPTIAGKSFQVRGILTDTSASAGQCQISLQGQIGVGPKVTLRVTSQNQSQINAVNDLIGQEVMVAGVSYASPGAGPASLVSRPGQIFIADNTPGGLRR